MADTRVVVDCSKPQQEMVEVIPLSAEEQTELDALRAQAASQRPMQDWVAKMIMSDAILPRWIEDHIDSDHGGITGSANLRQRYEQKKALRAQKP